MTEFEGFLWIMSENFYRTEFLWEEKIYKFSARKQQANRAYDGVIFEIFGHI